MNIPYSFNKYRLSIFALTIMQGIIFIMVQAANAQTSDYQLKVSDNQRFLVHENGEPFFYLGDTAWELFHRLNREEADLYLENRAKNGFTVIQAVVLAELNGLEEPNAYGEIPFIDMDISRPNEAYFEHVDWIVNQAESYGLYIGMLPTWGRWVGGGTSGFINETNAQDYGRFIAERYQYKPIIWVLGGDRPADRTRTTWNLMAQGIRDVVGNKQLITWHPVGGRSSSEWFHEAAWLDFNMAQSGHSAQSTNYTMIEYDYALPNPKPCMDGEAAYEYPPDAMPPHRPVGALQIRRNAYWAIFAGAHGHTYGTHPIWQMYDIGRTSLWDVVTPWHESLELPGAMQLIHLKNLILSRPFLMRIPDQTVLSGDAPDGLRRVQVTRDGTPGNHDATYIFAYFPRYQTIEFNTAIIPGDKLRVWWMNPATGEVSEPMELPNTHRIQFNPPSGAVEDRDIVRTEKTHVVYTRDSEGNAHLFVDGELVGNMDVGGDFSNWNSDFRLALGSELSGERHWLGTYHAVNLYNRALTSEEVASLASGSSPVENSSVQARYLFDEGSGQIVHDHSGISPALDLHIYDLAAIAWHKEGLELQAPSLIATENPPSRLINAMRESNAVSIEAWITPKQVTQAGPARIVTLSADTGQRNFTLGQEHENYLVRLRTTTTSENGLPALQPHEEPVEDWVLIIDDASKGYPAPLQSY